MANRNCADSRRLAALSGVASITMLGNAFAQSETNAQDGAPAVNDFAKMVPGLSMSDAGRQERCE
jgi:hypothetical protein